MRRSALPFIAAFAVLGVTAVFALAVLKIFYIGNYTIPQNGMYPTLPAGSMLFTRKHPYADASEVKRGDIVVFVRQERGVQYVYVWRVIALPGEKVETSGDTLSVNGQRAAREKLREAGGTAIFREQIGGASYDIALDLAPKNTLPDASLTVPAGTLFVMGDNRFNALDSRSFGPIPFEAIIGRKL